MLEIVTKPFGKPSEKKCDNCGRYHNGKPCGGLTVECYNCLKNGHFSRYCKEEKNQRPYRQQQSNNSIQKSVSIDSNLNQRPAWLNKKNKQNQLVSNDAHNYSNDQLSSQTAMGGPSKTEWDNMFQDYFDQSFYNGTKKQFMLQIKDAQQTKVNKVVVSSLADYEINGMVVNGTLDSGSGSTTQTYSSYELMNSRPRLLKFHGSATPFGSDVPIETRGCYFAKITCTKYNDRSHITKVLVVDKGDNILDNDTCQILGLLVIAPKPKISKSKNVDHTDRPPPKDTNVWLMNNQAVVQITVKKNSNGLQAAAQTAEKYGTSFDELYTGQYEGIDQSVYADKCRNRHLKLFKPNTIGKYKFPVKLHINYSVPPSRDSHDRTEIYLRPMVKTEIEELMALDLIEKLPPNYPTTWVSPIRIVPKKTGSGWRLTVNMVKLIKH